MFVDLLFFPFVAAGIERMIIVPNATGSRLSCSSEVGGSTVVGQAQGGPVSQVRHAVALTGANRNTIKHHLKQLVTAGTLVQRGAGRGTWYDKS